MTHKAVDDTITLNWYQGNKDRDSSWQVDMGNLSIKEMMVQKIANNVYVETEFIGCNTGFVVTRDGVVVIDPPQIPTDALCWRNEARKHGSVSYIINTEPHNDHVAGNYFFEGRVVAHEGTRKAILAASLDVYKEHLREIAPQSLHLPEEFSYHPPNITFSKRLNLYLDGHTFQLINLPGHTPYQVAVYVPEERVVFTSDNIVYKVQAHIHQALPYEWLDSLKQIQELDADVLVPGHGSICDRSYIPEMSDFVQAWIDAVTSAINKGMSLEEAQDEVSLLDRYPMPPGVEFMARQWQRANVAHLYEALRSYKGRLLTDPGAVGDIDKQQRRWEQPGEKA